MNTQALRDTIAVARRHEDVTGQLEQRLRALLPRLHHAIKLPAVDAIPSLRNLVMRYIEQVPELLDAAALHAADAGVADVVEPLLQLASDYFLKPTELLTGRVGFDELLDEAYLAQRLVEEAEDYSIRAVGRMLTGVDIAHTNLIVHHLIGEPFANELEEAVSLACQRLRAAGAGLAPVSDRQHQHCRPCMAAQHNISLLLPGCAELNDHVV